MALGGTALQPSYFDELKLGDLFFFNSCFNIIYFGLAQISFSLWHLHAVAHSYFLNLFLCHIPTSLHWYCVLPIADNVNRFRGCLQFCVFVAMN